VKIALVNMPVASTRYPSIQLGLLKSILSGQGHEVDVHYLNLDFAHRIGWEKYERLATQRFLLVNEWLFSVAAFGPKAPPSALFVDHLASEFSQLAASYGWTSDEFVELRDIVAPEFIDDCLTAIDWARYDLVGFGSMFEQNCAALALSRLIKERFPKVQVVFGGSNFDDPMGLEYMRVFPWIDHAVIGEGDQAFPSLVEALEKGGVELAIKGVASRCERGSVCFPGPADLVREMDSLPTPDYDEYFVAKQDLGMPETLGGRGIWLLFESSRGCWWGAKQHCTFCGLNADGMAYRSKSADTVENELTRMALRYGRREFQAVDNILDTSWLTSLFPKLESSGSDIKLFYEVKANLRKDQLRTLARGGVALVQPGLESLSTNVLKIMRKGTSKLQNVNFLRWAMYYDIEVGWNLLYGFPGETDEDYEEQLATIEMIQHLQPPTGVGSLRLDRFSPYHSSPSTWKIEGIEPFWAYRTVYPIEINVEQIAYFFDYGPKNVVSDALVQRLKRAVEGWRGRWSPGEIPQLSYRKFGNHGVIRDHRQPGELREFVIDAPELVVLELLSERPVSIEMIASKCGLRANSVADMVERLREMRCVISEGNVHLALPLPSNRFH
jgi:ribosomal peptide maturation radical SAM protein 1